ncbi:MAG: membrane dipeptidase [Phycisphaerales bacterium]|jgi:membrane dipeptidase
MMQAREAAGHPSEFPFFDAHLDLAYLAEVGRDLHATTDDCRGRYIPASVTLPAMADAGVTHCLGTIFTEAIFDYTAPDAETGAFAYPAGDALAAWKAGQRQLKLYQAWRDAGVIRLLPKRGDSAHETVGSGEATGSTPPLTLGILIECADPIEKPEQMEEWAQAGVVAVGMAWWHQGRYASGNGVTPGSKGDGLTPEGFELIKEIDRLGVVHDLSHLSQRSSDQLLEATGATVIASHSNSRAMMPGLEEQAAQRHLNDETIREICARGGVIGLNLFSSFLHPGASGTKRASIDDAVRHIEHVCEIAGSRAHTALGSDADGGFAANRLPEGLDRLTDLRKITDALSARGWSDDEVRGFAFNNWARFWGMPTV